MSKIALIWKKSLKHFHNCKKKKKKKLKPQFIKSCLIARFINPIVGQTQNVKHWITVENLFDLRKSLKQCHFYKKYWLHIFCPSVANSKDGNIVL